MELGQRIKQARLEAGLSQRQLCGQRLTRNMLSLIEKVENEIDEKEAQKAADRLMENKFDLNDLLSQFQQIKKMGSMKQLLSMLPGMGNQIKDVDIDEREFARIEAIIQSMTAKERSKPDILNASRRRRIAAGAGTTVENVNKLMRQYEQMKKMFKQLNGKNGKRRFGGGMGLPPGFNL